MIQLRGKQFFSCVSILFCVLGTAGCTHSIQSESVRTNHSEVLEKPYVVLVSIDGYRYDYTTLYSPPTLTKIANAGEALKAYFLFILLKRLQIITVLPPVFMLKITEL